MYIALEPLLERALLGVIALVLSIPLGIIFARMLGVSLAARALHRRAAKIFSRLNRQNRMPYTLAMRGAFVMAILALVAWSIGMIGTHIIYPTGRNGSLLGLSFLIALLNAGGIFYPLWQMARAATAQDWPALDGYVNRLAPASHAADGHGKIRMGIQLATGHVQHRIIGSLIAYILFDFHGLLTYRAMHLSATHAPSILPNWRAFGLLIGWAFTPLRIITHTLLVICGTIAGACIPGCKPFPALRAVRSENAYLATLLQISLGGGYTLYGKAFREPWVGSGTAKLEAVHARRATGWIVAIILIIALLIGGLSIMQPSIAI